MKIKIRFHVQSWSGFDKNLPSPQEKELILSKGDKLKAKDLGEFTGSAFIVTEPNIEIVDVSESGIEILTNGLVETNPDGGVNLKKDSHKLHHYLAIGKTLKLVTQTMDSGFSISITPLEVIA